MRKVLSFLIVATVLFTSCATSISQKSLEEKVASVISDAASPSSLHVQPRLEVTGLRWTLHRGEFKKGSPDSPVISSAPDSPIGFDLGNGLFLDGNNNLSLLALDVAGVPPTADYKASFETHNGNTLFSFTSLKTVKVEAHQGKYAVEAPGPLGPVLSTIDTGTREILAMNKKIMPLENGRFKVLDTFDLLAGRVQNIEKTDYGWNNKTDVLFGTSDYYVTGDEGSVKTTDDRIALKIVDNYILVRGDQFTYRIYHSETKTWIVREKDGMVTTIEKTPDGLILRNDSIEEKLILGKS